MRILNELMMKLEVRILNFHEESDVDIHFARNTDICSKLTVMVFSSPAIYCSVRLSLVGAIGTDC